jgi:eukaryotic-like serine/threonine-protein kinase
LYSSDATPRYNDARGIVTLRPAAAFEGNERFRVVRQIGAGGMGVVYEAYDRERHCNVALKTLRTREPQAILRLKHEFRALRDLQHRNLVSFGELLESDGRWFFTMELVHGVDLLNWVRVPAASDAAPGRNPTQ